MTAPRLPFPVPPPSRGGVRTLPRPEVAAPVVAAPVVAAPVVAAPVVAAPVVAAPVVAAPTVVRPRTSPETLTAPEAPAPVLAPAATDPGPPATSPQTTTVLVTGSGGPAGVAVVRRLIALGHRVVAVDADPAAAGSALATVGRAVPRADAPGFVDALVAVAAEHGAVALIGTVAEELPALTAAADRLRAAGLATWLPPLTAVDLCCDKSAFATCMSDAGVPHPRTTSVPSGVDDVPGPWIVKPRAGRGSRGVQLLDTPAAVIAALTADPELIAQTRLTGREFTADALVGRDGGLVTVVPRWRDVTKAGISVQGETFESEAVTAVVADALAAVRLTGPANVQGFVAADGTVTVVEINPRFSGGLPLTLAAGADVVAAYLAGVRDPAAQLPFLWFTPGVRMSRYFAETYTGPGGAAVVDPCAVPVSAVPVGLG